jgi:hypothetical protein
MTRLGSRKVMLASREYRATMNASRPWVHIVSMLALVIVLTGCGAVFINPGSRNASLASGIANPNANRQTKEPNIKGASAVFVDDSIAAMYPYGGANGAMSDDEVYSGKLAIKCNLNGGDYSGVICETGQLFDLKKAREDGQVLRFWIKGDNGGEPVFISLTDSKAVSKEVEVFVDIAKYGGITTEWKQVQIPLKDFPDIGGYYDGVKMVDGVPIRWDKVEEFRVKDNRSGKGLYTIYVDEVVVSPPVK